MEEEATAYAIALAIERRRDNGNFKDRALGWLLLTATNLLKKDNKRMRVPSLYSDHALEARRHLWQPLKIRSTLEAGEKILLKN